MSDTRPSARSIGFAPEVATTLPQGLTTPKSTCAIPNPRRWAALPLGQSIRTLLLKETSHARDSE